jgi:hypothetical protein
MTATIWTLWLISYAMGQGSPVLTPMGTYSSEQECMAFLEEVGVDHRKAYGKSVAMPGVFFCVGGVPAKR